MPFSEEFLQTTSREIESRSLTADFDLARAFIVKALKKCAEVDYRIDPENVDIYIHGSYANKSNIYFPSNLEIMVEITTTKRFSPEEVSLEGNYFVDVPLDFGPREFRILLTDALREMVGDKLTEHAKTLRLSGLEKIKHDVDITPCVNFHFYQDTARTRGILLYDASINRNIVSFPRLHAQNGFDKDQSTSGNFKRIVRMFKTLHSLNVNEFSFADSNTASGYFIECLLYNVPNQMFIDKGGVEQDDESLNEIFNKVMNYLINTDLEEFVCQNQIWKLFATPAEFWDKSRAEACLGAIIRLYSVFPPSRVFLA